MRSIVVFLAVFCPSLSYANQAELIRCAAELKAIHPDQFNSQIFHVNGLVLGSSRVASSGKQHQILLFVSNVRATKAYVLQNSTNRMRIEFPHADPRRENQTHFIQYSHSDTFGSRLGEAFVDITAQGGPAPSDYRLLKPVALSEAASRRHVLQLIADEVSRVSRLHIKGKLSRADLLAGNLSLCRGLKIDDPKLARWLEAQVAELEIASTPVKSSNRSPASNFDY